MWSRNDVDIWNRKFVSGMGCIAIGAIVAYKIINRKSPEERENEEYLKETTEKL